MDNSLLEGGAYIKHVTAERLVIGCNETGDSFELTCEQGRWIGVRTNCSSSFARKSSRSLCCVIKILLTYLLTHSLIHPLTYLLIYFTLLHRHCKGLVVTGFNNVCIMRAS